MWVTDVERHVRRSPFSVETPFDQREETVDAPHPLLEIPRCPGDSVVENAVTKQVQVHAFLERVRTDDHPREGRCSELSRCCSMCARSPRDADHWHGVIELRPAFFTGELAPTSPRAIEAAVNNKTEMGYPLGAVMSKKAGASVLRRQPLEEALGESFCVVPRLLVGEVEVEQSVRESKCLAE